MALFAIAAAFAGASAAIGARGARREKNAAKDDARAVTIRNLQQRRAFLQDFRQQRAEALAAGINTGVGIGSSGIQGARSSVTTQAILGIQEGQQLEKLGQTAATLRGKASKDRAVAGLFSTASSIVGGFGARQPITSEELNKATSKT